MTSEGLKPFLLIDDYGEDPDLVSIRKAIIENHCSSLAMTVPMCRFRGTAMACAGEKTAGAKIIGWQRNVSRIRGMDVSMPTIITLSLNGNQEIIDIELDGAFRGSRGLLCSGAYLNGVLKKRLVGLPLDIPFLQAATVRNLHCFHLVEVLGGIFTFFTALRAGKQTGRTSFLYEEEVMDCFIRGNDCYAVSCHRLKDREPVFHTLKFNGIFKIVGFDKQGNLKGLENVPIDFFINGSLVLNNDALRGRSGTNHRDFVAFIMNCLEALKPWLWDGLSIRCLNTNLVPGSLLGLIVQCIAMQTFRNNYTYVMHALSALQRPGGTPLCIGAVRDKDEAACHFPGYDFENLLP